MVTDLPGAEEFKANSYKYEMSTIEGISINQNISFGPYSTGVFKQANQNDFYFTLNNENGENSRISFKATEKQITKTVNVAEQNKEVASGNVLNINLELLFKNQRGSGVYQSNERKMFSHRLLKMNMLPYKSFSRETGIRFDGVLFRSEDNSELIGAVDCRENVLWMDKSLSEDQLQIMATVAAALIFKPR
jgi:hypothetical protein